MFQNKEHFCLQLHLRPLLSHRPYFLPILQNRLPNEVLLVSTVCPPGNFFLGPRRLSLGRPFILVFGLALLERHLVGFIPFGLVPEDKVILGFSLSLHGEGGCGLGQSLMGSLEGLIESEYFQSFFLRLVDG